MSYIQNVEIFCKVIVVGRGEVSFETAKKK